MNQSINQTEQNLFPNNKSEKARWPGGKASVSRAKGRGSILTERAMLCPLSKTNLLLKSTGNTQKAVALTDMKNVYSNV